MQLILDPLGRLIHRLITLKTLILIPVAGMFLAGCREDVRESEHSPSEYQTTYASLSDSVVRLPTGDSLEFQATGPATVPDQPTGLLVTYHPFVDIDDTVRVRNIAYSFFKTLRSDVERAGTSWVVMRAVDRRASARTGQYELRSFGVVLERRKDGLWYRMDESQPIPLL